MQVDAIVHVIDDDDAVRQSLEFLLRTAGLEVKTYESASAFLAARPPVSSGCVITDVRMPDIGGIDLLRRLNELEIAVPVIVITGHADVPLAVEAMKLGAVDFFEKPFDDDALLAAVSTSLDSNRDDSKRSAERAEINHKLASLSNRERQVLEGLVSGHPNKTIAYDLGISPRIVEIYRANLMTKMNAASLSDLVRMACWPEFWTAAKSLEAGRAVTGLVAASPACPAFELDQGAVGHSDVSCGSQLAQVLARNRWIGRNMIWRLVLAALSVMVLGHPAIAEDSAALEKRGEALLAKHCARCHAIGRAGTSPHPKAPPFWTLSRKYPIESLAEALAEGIFVGHPDMPEFAFEADEVGAILTYLELIQER